MKLKYVAFLLCVAGSSYSCSSMPSMPSFAWNSGPKSDATAEALFADGMRSFNEKRYARAIDNFTKLRTDYPFDPQVTQVELKIADAYYLNQQYPEAINAFKEYQSMHPTNENIPFVLLRLGQAHFDQFTSVDRDQKNTEIAKGYFENVISSYPKSSQAAEAKEKLLKCLEYLAEHEFNVAYFYFQQEKYPAARDRFEEIVRKYKDTPTAVKSLFYLGESYRNEKNVVRATLAYEALIEHYPETKFAADAKIQLAKVDKEKRDPLALLLMRDRRPTAVSTPEVKEDPALAKLKDLNLVAKTDVVYEEPGEQKGFFRRVADKLNPFSSDGNEKKEEKPSESPMEILAKRSQAEKEAQKKQEQTKQASGKSVNRDGNASSIVSQIDDSLQQKGIDAASREAALKPPAADLPNTDDLGKVAKNSDTAALLSSVDSNLQKSGKDATDLPPVPEIAEGFKNPAVTQAIIAKAAQKQEASKDVQSSGVLSSIDQQLQARGVEPAQFERPPTAEEVKATTAEKARANNKVELEPKLSVEKGPLYLNPAQVETREKSAEPVSEEPKNTAPADPTPEIPSRVLVKGPIQQPQANAAAREPQVKRASLSDDDESKGMFDQLKQDVDSASKLLNPFRW